MAGEPAPLAAVQAAVLKTAASKQASTGDPAAASQAGAVAQDLAVMADQAKGYAAGVNQGTIVAQDNRAAQSRRLAQEAAQAQADRARQLQLEQMQTAQMRLDAEGEAARDQGRLEEERLRQAKAGGTDDQAEWDAAGDSVIRHSMMNRGPRFQTALTAVLGNATSAAEAVAILRNAKRHPDEFGWAPGIKEDVLRKYATEYFRAIQGGAVNLKRLNPPTPAPKRQSFLTTGLESAIRSRG
jgi:hypothetical protein